MLNKRLLILIVLLLSVVALPTLAQDETETEEEEITANLTDEQLERCTAFPDASADVRTSYYMGEATAFMQTRQVQSAIVSYSCVIQRIDDTYLDAYLNRAIAYYERRDFERAILDYSSVIELDPNFLPAINNRGVIYIAQDEFELALDDFNRVLDQDSSFVPSLTNRGLVHALEDDYDAALADFEQLITEADLAAVLEELRDPDRPSDAEDPEFDRDAARAYALIALVYERIALDNYEDYLALFGNRSDGRIQSAAGALQSRFRFDLRFDDGAFVLIAEVNPEEEE